MSACLCRCHIMGESWEKTLAVEYLLLYVLTCGLKQKHIQYNVTVTYLTTRCRRHCLLKYFINLCSAAIIVFIKVTLKLGICTTDFKIVSWEYGTNLTFYFLFFVCLEIGNLYKQRLKFKVSDSWYFRTILHFWRILLHHWESVL